VRQLEDLEQECIQKEEIEQQAKIEAVAAEKLREKERI
jgi:hypothetical protein